MEHLAADLFLDFEAQMRQVNVQIGEGIVSGEEPMVIDDLQKFDGKDVEGTLDVGRIHQQRRGNAPPAPWADPRAGPAQGVRRHFAQYDDSGQRRLPGSVARARRFPGQQRRDERIAVEAAKVLDEGFEGRPVFGIQLGQGQSVSGSSRYSP